MKWNSYPTLLWFQVKSPKDVYLDSVHLVIQCFKDHFISTLCSGVITTNCSFSEFSTYDKPINYFVPDGKVLAGVVSLHHDFYK